MPRKKKSFTTGNSRGGSVKGVCLSIGSGVWWDCFAEIAWTFIEVLTAEITLRQAFCYLALRTPPCGLGWELSFLTERWGSSYTKWSNNLLRITPASWKLTRDGHLRWHGPVEMYTYRIKKIPRAHIRQERETVEIHVDSIFYLIHPKYIISMCGQHITNKKLLMRWFAFFFVLSSKSGVYFIHSTFRPDTFQVLDIHPWLVATVLDRTEFFGFLVFLLC